MPATAHKARGHLVLLTILSLSAGSLGGQDAPPASGQWMSAISKLASALSQNDAAGALETFDPAGKSYGELEADISSLTAQADIICAIDVVENKEVDGIALLDVDWYVQLKSRAEGGPSERRRERVQLRMKQIRGKWKIVSIDPIKILDPIHIN